MTLDINAHRWMFLEPDKAGAYVELYKGLREEGWKKLVLATTRRQFATARAILDRMNTGQQGVLLADDVGLGKTTVAALCALIFAGSEKSVRILAPNEMMSRRWRQELEVHIKPIAKFARHLDLDRAQRRIRIDVRRLNPGTIAVSTHQKATQLACDLLIIDEAHRARSDGSALARQVRRQGKDIGRVLVLTATPFSIDPNDLARLLVRIGGKSAEKPMRKYSRMLEDLWRGRSPGAPEEFARQLVSAAKLAVEAMRPYVIRHGIDDLPSDEQRAFGKVEDSDAAKPLVVPDDLLEAMLRADRALPRNDPRYHVAAGQLDADLTALLGAVAVGDDDTAALAVHHARIARKLLRANGRHPKIKDTVETTRLIVEEGEKVLIFCDHHLPAVELTAALADEIRWSDAPSKQCPSKDRWRSAWSSIFSDLRKEAGRDDGRGHSVARLDHYLDWLLTDGVCLQIWSWLSDDRRPDLASKDLGFLLDKMHARRHVACDTIANHAKQLYKQLVDRESGSTRAILSRDETTRLPGTTRARVAAVCNPDSGIALRKYPGVFYSGQPDATLVVFNSPFGPDILVTTDRLSEGVDLHRFCRHLIHHELDPSPVRTVQRNGRVRRVNSWASRSKQPIRILYPALQGTRDEKLVEIMRYRLLQFDLLLGGIRVKVLPEEAETAPTTAAEILDHARARLGRIRLGI